MESFPLLRVSVQDLCRLELWPPQQELSFLASPRSLLKQVHNLVLYGTRPHCRHEPYTTGDRLVTLSVVAL